MSLTLKIGSLLIRTLAKPIANGIKRGARNHEPFRRKCVSFAQALHRLDVRWRVGLLQDPAVIEKQIQREIKEAEARRRAAQAPTVKTEAETKADEEALKKEKEAIEEKHKHKTPRVRPLSETKAIDMGANFISETFMFLVAGGIIVWEQWRSRKKASDRRDIVDEKLEELEEKHSQLMEEIRMLKARIAPEEVAKEEAQRSIDHPSSAAKTPAAPSEPSSKVAASADSKISESKPSASEVRKA
ncbi:Optic atrophy 3-like protein [Macrophomina phaseolina MS6]|uniref:Optic atrophy 3-like protein n=2 Tax=Macrophomina phaseolina TaxID=35725 RepID=K2SBI2_MACPH|nr:Optic atrophy 3-like protein [Macrophomina phaseolina MS6]KAH7060918.1 optic atrophy 3 protein-domain-containing protein [Macrophomina phaseolina]